MTQPAPRAPGHSISPLFVDRWSPRAFDRSDMRLEDLMVLLEAARWSPSGANVQPWRMVYALRSEPAFAGFLSTLDPGNQKWAHAASALVFFVSDPVANRGTDRERQSGSHAFDTGAAWMAFALQAQLNGYATHAMGGFSAERARAELAIPADFVIHCAVAVGRHGSAEQLPDDLKAREFPNARKPLAEIVHAGRFT